MADALGSGARGAGIIVASQAVKVLLQFLTTIVLSRLLTPDDFGIVAMVAVFVAFGDMLRDLGMTTIGLQRKELSHQQASNLFWISSFLGLCLAVALAASAGLLVLLYSEPRLWWVVPAFAPALLINALAAQVRVQLARRMRFGLLAATDTAPQVVNLLVAAGLALLGWAYWSIIAGTLCAALVGLIAAWLGSRWWPTMPRRDGTSRQLIKDGAAFGLAGFLTFLSQNVDTAVVGVRWNPADLGIYNRGYQLLSLPMSRLMGPLTQVVIPTVNAATKEGRSVDAVLLRIQFGFGFVVVWTFATAGAISGWLVPSLLGQNWIEVAPLFQIFSAGGLVWSFANINYWRVILGNQGLQLAYYNAFSKSLGVGMIICASFVSLAAVAAAVSTSLLVNWVGGLLWFRVAAGWDSWRYFREALRLILPGGVALVLGSIAMDRWSGAEHASIALAVAFGVTGIYTVGVLVTPGGLRELLGALKVARRMVVRDKSLVSPVATAALPVD